MTDSELRDILLDLVTAIKAIGEGQRAVAERLPAGATMAMHAFADALDAESRELAHHTDHADRSARLVLAGLAGAIRRCA